MSNYQQLLANFEILGLHKTKEYFPNYLEVVTKKTIPFTEALLELTHNEIIFRAENKKKRAIEKARFPKQSCLIIFEFGFQPSINKKEVLDLGHMSFLSKHENVIFIDNPGIGKSDLATGIGIDIEACEQGVRTLFINCQKLIQKLQTAYEKGTNQQVMKRYIHHELLIINEIGYLPIQKMKHTYFSS